MGLSITPQDQSTNEDSLSDAMDFLRTTENKIKTSTEKSTARLGFPSLRELSMPQVHEEPLFDNGGIADEGKKEKFNKKNLEEKERDQGLEEIRRALLRKGGSPYKVTKRRRRLLQELPPPSNPPFKESDGDAHGESNGDEVVIDNPEGEGTYEKLEEKEDIPCDDGQGPNPNILKEEPKQEDENINDDGNGGPLTKLEKIIKKTINKYSKYDLTTGQVWMKAKKDRIPMCPGAKPREPIPGIDCTLVKREPEKYSCCKCGCGGCCAMLRRVITKSYNKFHKIDMDTGKEYSNKIWKLPYCSEYNKDQITYPIDKEKDRGLKALLNRKIEDDDKRMSTSGKNGKL